MLKFLRKAFGIGEPRPTYGDTRVTYWKDDRTGWNWHLQDGNNEVLCGSNQGYGSESELISGVENARDALNTAVLVRRTLAS